MRETTDLNPIRDLQIIARNLGPGGHHVIAAMIDAVRPRLSPTHESIIHLLISDVTQEEIAEVLDRPISKVQQLASQAAQRFQRRRASR